MNSQKQNLLKEAIDQYKVIFPCGSTNDFDNCFTQMDDKLIFWFNTEDNNTHLLIDEDLNIETIG